MPDRQPARHCYETADLHPPIPSSLIRGWRFLDLVRTASSGTVTQVFAASGLAWIPLVLLSDIRGTDVLLSFLTDYASGTRFLIILPVAILAEPQLRDRLARVAHQF